MFLKSLTLKGFKSFADPATLVFEPGITVIVGPNGSGKSNIVDAVAWVLGAQAPTAVRSQKMDDVVFAGTSLRSALGRAEVQLTIDNSARLLPVDFEEVKISRTLFRNGDSSYSLNGAPCRLLDIQELLSDTGVGRQQHLIISQRQIEAVLSTHPEDRRAIIEEAAGVRKFRRRKEKSQRSLAATEANLARLSDVQREVRRQLRPLEHQAEAARRHGDVLSELSALRRHLLGREIAQLRQSASQNREAADVIGGEINILEAGFASLDAQIEAAQQQLSDPHTQDVLAALARCERLHERLKGMQALLGERSLRLRVALDADADVETLVALEAEAQQCKTELASLEQQDGELVSEEAELAAAEQGLAQQREEFESRWGDQSAPVATHDVARLRGELGAVEETLAQQTTELETLRGRAATLAGQKEQLDAQLGRSQQVLSSADDTLVSHQQAAQAAAEELQAAQQHTERSTAAVAETKAVLQAWTARVEALTVALDEVRAQAGAAHVENLDGVLGTLLELVDIDPGWEAAFDAAVGDAVAALVASDAQTARRVIDALHANDATGAVIALGRPQALAAVASVGEPLRVHVRSHTSGVEDLLDALLGGIGVVDTAADAVEASLEHAAATVVTRSGDRFTASGWRIGTRRAAATRAAQVDARHHAEQAAAEMETVTTQLQTAEQAATEATTAHTAALRASEEAAHARQSAQQTVQSDERQLRDVIVSAEALQTRLEELQQRVADSSDRADRLRQELAAAQAAEEQEQSHRQDMAADLQDLDTRSAAVATLRTDLQVRAAGLTERRSLLRSRLHEIQQRLEHREQSQHAGRREAVVAQQAVVEQLADLLAGRAAELQDCLEELRRRYAEQSDASREVARRLEELRRQRTTAETQLGKCRERAQRIEIDLAEVDVRLQAAVDRCRSELDCEPGQAVAAVCPPLPEGVEAVERARTLERELRIMGPINPLALEEYDSLSERFEFLQEQITDIRSSRRELQKVIRKVDEEIVQVFTSAYADVSQNFAELFGTLFPGGRGSLALVQPDELLTSGVEIEARPSGKNVKRLSLLSGGERSLTALAFLFAVFRSRPSPFYVMDEVEAALDDVNLHRFLQLIEEFREEAQLLVVSHQKRTMEAADCLYGVSMKPGGSSTILSEKISPSDRRLPLLAGAAG